MTLLVAGVLSINWTDASSRPSKPPEDRHKEDADAKPAPTQKKGTAKRGQEPAVTSNPPSPQKMLELPDGTFVPALNGAVNAKPLVTAWDPQVPYAKIIRQERAPDGVDWYVHADGSFSTTRMVFRDDLKRMDAVTSVAHPGGEAPAAAAPREPQKR